jgi:hypothetical protein
MQRSPGACAPGDGSLHAPANFSARARSAAITARFDPKSIFLGALLAYVLLLHSPFSGGVADTAAGRQRRELAAMLPSHVTTIADAAAPSMPDGNLRLKGASSISKHGAAAQNSASAAGAATAGQHDPQPGGGGGGGRVFPMTAAAVADAGTSRAMQRMIVPDVQVGVSSRLLAFVDVSACIISGMLHQRRPNLETHQTPTPHQAALHRHIIDLGITTVAVVSPACDDGAPPGGRFAARLPRPIVDLAALRRYKQLTVHCIDRVERLPAALKAAAAAAATAGKGGGSVALLYGSDYVSDNEPPTLVQTNLLLLAATQLAAGDAGLWLRLVAEVRRVGEVEKGAEGAKVNGAQTAQGGQAFAAMKAAADINAAGDKAEEAEEAEEGEAEEEVDAQRRRLAGYEGSNSPDRVSALDLQTLQWTMWFKSTPVFRDRFNWIYAVGEWKGGGGSGDGSTLNATKVIRAALPGLFKKHGIKSFMDTSCGSMYWMPTLLEDVEKTIPGFKFHGTDVVCNLTNTHAKRWRKTKPNWKFSCVDYTNEPLPTGYDAIWSRDSLQHLPLHAVWQFLNNARASGAKFLFVGSYLTKPFGNEHQRAGESLRLVGVLVCIFVYSA